LAITQQQWEVVDTDVLQNANESYMWSKSGNDWSRLVIWTNMKNVNVSVPSTKRKDLWKMEWDDDEEAGAKEASMVEVARATEANMVTLESAADGSRHSSNKDDDSKDSSTSDTSETLFNQVMIWWPEIPTF
jgi:hypothetical protein